MSPFLGLVQIISGPSGYDLLLVLQVILKHLEQIEDFRLVIHQRQHDRAKGILQLCMLIQLVQYHVGVGIPSHIDTDPHALTAGMIADAGNAVDFFIAHKLRHLLDQAGLVDQVGKLRDDDLALPVGKRLDIADRADTNLAAPGAVGLLDSSGTQDLCSSREVRPLDDGHDLVDRGLPVLLHDIVDDLDDSGNNLPEVVGRNIGRHTDGNAGGSVYQQIRKSGGKDHRLLLGIIKVWNKIYRILVQVSDHLHGYPAQPGLGISHGCRAVAVHGTKVSMAVHQRVAHVPVLGHIDQGSVDRAVTMGMIFTHRITDDTRALSVRLVGTVVQLCHGEKDPSLNRLHSVSDVRKGTGGDYTHRVIDIGVLHFFLQIYFFNSVEDLVIHRSIILLLICCQISRF